MPWADRGSLVLDSAEALRALTSLPADNPAPSSWSQDGGREGWFGNAWEDVDGNGCDTRNDILGRDLTDADYSRRPGIQGIEAGRGAGVSSCPNATVWAGVLHDPYTGEDISFRRGNKTSSAVQIDHVVPLNYLYAHGAWSWDARTRLLAANDPLNLVAVKGSVNESKSNCGPATCPSSSSAWNPAQAGGWWPPETSYRCIYAQRFVSVLAAYSLGIPDADRSALQATLTDCAAGGNGDTGHTRVSGSSSTIFEHRDAIVGLVVLAIGLISLMGGRAVRVRMRAPVRRPSRRRTNRSRRTGRR